MSDSPLIQRMRAIVQPIASDLGLDLYDIEQRGATLRVTLDTMPGQPAGIDLEQLALATRLVSRELDHQDPVPGKYTLEITSPGVERNLRTPAHFQREVGKTINVRLVSGEAALRRVEGVLAAADATTATILADDGTQRVIALADVDRARTVFVWGPQPKPGAAKKGGKKAAAKASAANIGSQPTPDDTDPDDTDTADDDDEFDDDLDDADADDEFDEFDEFDDDESDQDPAEPNDLEPDSVPESDPVSVKEST